MKAFLTKHSIIRVKSGSYIFQAANNYFSLMSERCARECIIQRAYRNFIYLPCTDPTTNNSRFREDELGRSLPLDLMTVNHRQPFRLKLERDKVTSLHGDNIRPRIILPRDAAIEQEQETRHTAEIHRFGTVSGRGRG